MDLELARFFFIHFHFRAMWWITIYENFSIGLPYSAKGQIFFCLWPLASAECENSASVIHWCKGYHHCLCVQILLGTNTNRPYIFRRAAQERPAERLLNWLLPAPGVINESWHYTNHHHLLCKQQSCFIAKKMTKTCWMWPSQLSVLSSCLRISGFTIVEFSALKCGEVSASG